MTIRIDGEIVGVVKGVQIVPKLPSEGPGFFIKILGEIDSDNINQEKINNSKVIVMIVEK